MLDVHPPHHAASGWRDFFVHIATIVIGLLIAVGLEQTVEYFHHRHLVAEFQQQMHEELDNDVKILDGDILRQDDYRGYLVDLQAAINAKLAGQPYKMPARDDPRNHSGFILPLLIPFLIAQQNGTLAYVDADQAAVYSRLAVQKELIQDISRRYLAALDASRAFRIIYDPTPENLDPDFVAMYADPGNLSAAELIEYRRVNAAVISQIDAARHRFEYMSLAIQCTLDGAKQRDMNDCIGAKGHAYRARMQAGAK